VIGKGGKVKLYHLSRETRASISIIGSKKVKKDQTCWARFRFESPIFAFPGDRFIIRSETPVKTIGGGIIVANKAAKRTTDELEMLHRLLLSDPIKTLSVYINESRYMGRAPEELRQLTGLGIEEIIEILNGLKERKEIFKSTEGSRFIDAGNMSGLKRKISSVIGQYHIKSPEKPGIHIKELSDRLDEKTDSSILDYALQSLISEKTLILHRNSYSLCQFSDRFSGEEAQTGEKIEKYYIDAFLTPLARKNVWKEIDEPESMTHTTTKALLADSTLIKVSDDYLIHEESFKRLREGLDEIKCKSGEISISDFKEKFGLSRKFAIPLLEFLDYEGVTRKKPDGDRIIL
jgi:selenocysteine-specific elongation factor